MKIIAENVRDNTGERRKIYTVQLNNGSTVDVMQYYPNGRLAVYVVDPCEHDFDEVSVTSFVRKEIYRKRGASERTCSSLKPGEIVVFLAKEFGEHKSVLAFRHF